jgi:hypothetical protein
MTDKISILCEWVSQWSRVGISLTVHHVPARGGMVLLDTVEAATKADKTDKSGALAWRLESSARAHVETQPIDQKYCAVATVNGEVQSHRFFQLSPSRPAAPEPDPERVPEKAIVVQSMKHAEEFAKTLLKAHDALYGHVIDALREQRLELKDAREERVKLMALTQDLMDRQQARDLEVKEAEKDLQMKDKGLALLQNFGKMAYGHLTKNTPVARLLKSLTEEQFLTIAGTLNPTQLDAIKAVVADDEVIEQAEKEMHGDLKGVGSASP